MLYWVCEMRCGVRSLIIFNCGKVRSSSFVIHKIVVWFVVVVVVVVIRHTQKIHPMVHAAAGARACPSNGIRRICDFDFWHEKSI